MSIPNLGKVSWLRVQHNATTNLSSPSLGRSWQGYCCFIQHYDFILSEHPFVNSTKRWEVESVLATLIQHRLLYILSYPESGGESFAITRPLASPPEFIQKLLMLCNTTLFLLPSVQCFCVTYMWVRLPSPFINRITLPPHIIFMLATYFPVVKNRLDVKYMVLIQIICFSLDLLVLPLFKFSKCCCSSQPMTKLVCVVLRAITQPGNKVLCFPPFFGWFATTQDPINIVLWVTFNIHRSRTADGELYTGWSLLFLDSSLAPFLPEP